MSADNSPWNKNEEHDQAKAKNLLDNVSLMTTISPMPSQNNTMQQGVSKNGTQDLLEEVFGNVKTNTGTFTSTNEERGDPYNMSTFTNIQAKLRAQLESTGTTMGTTSTPPTTHQINPPDSGGEKIMYGFDLSPIHSVDKGTGYTTTQDDVPSTEVSGLKNRGEFRMAPNFMQAKGASKVLKSDKSAANEDTETMMSQVFSSQDITSSVNGIRTRSRDEKTSGRTASCRKGSDTIPKNDSLERQKRNTDFSTKKQTQRTPTATKSLKPRDGLSGTKPKTKGSKSTPVKKTLRSPSPEIVPPKSPKTRQSAVKVTPRMKSTPGKTFTKPVVNKTKPSPSQSRKKQKSPDSSYVSPARSRVIYKDSLEMSSTTGLVPEIRAGGVKNHEETVSLIHILDDLNDMRSQVAEVQGQLSLVSSEKEHLEKENKILKEENVQLKKDNFLMKSRLEKMMSSEKVKESSDVEEVDAGGDNRLEKLKEDMAEQERLISGFQKENERIYGELKKAKQTSKEVEQAMYEENLKLKSEIAKLKEEVELHTAINKAHHGGLENVRISDFNSDDVSHDVKELKTKIHLLENQVKAEEGLRLKADSLVRKITEERDRAEKQLTVNSCKTEESRSKLIAEHKAELENVKSELADARRMLASKSDAALTIRDIMNSPPSKSLLTHFQRRVKKLESDLENRDTRASKAVASVQEQYSSIKSRYEERINDLEKQIKAFRENMNKKGDSQIETVEDKQALEKKLSETLLKLKEESEHRRMERDALFEQINMLRQQNAAAKERRPPVNDSNLRREVEDKNKEIERLNALVEKLGNTVPRGRRAPVKSGNKKSSYNPNSFEGEGYSGLMEQNAVLKKELQDKELEHKHSQVTKDAHIAKLEQEIKALKLVHDKDLENMREKESVQHLPDAENQFLNDKLAALEQELKLRCQEIFELKSDLKEAAVAKVREQALQQQIQQLVGQVHEARLCSPSSSARKVASLEDKLRVLDEKLRIKERELKNSIVQNSSAVVQSEIEDMQIQLERKNRELTRFRLELDSILLVLKELHSQGVKIPLPKYLQSLF